MNKKKLQKTQKEQQENNELEKMTELAKRAMADLQNLKRRQEEEKSTWIKMANADLIKDLLPILDNLDRAKEHMPKEAEDWGKGIEMSINQLHQVMNNAGLKKIESTGKPFNPDLHEALMEGEGEKGMVIEEFEKGYILGDRVIRHAKVKVGKS
jgi:molecular chaperone GrpE